MGFGGLLGASSAGKAIKTYKDAIKFTKKVYGETKENVKPYIEGGTGAFTRLASDDFRNMQFYAFREEEANRAIQRGLSLRGGYFSGAGLEAEARANMQLSGEQVQNEQNLLLALSQIGQQSALGLGSLGNQAASNVSATSNALGQAQITRGILRGQGIDSFIGAAIGGVQSAYSMGQSSALNNAQIGVLEQQANYLSRQS